MKIYLILKKEVGVLIQELIAEETNADIISIDPSKFKEKEEKIVQAWRNEEIAQEMLIQYNLKANGYTHYRIKEMETED